MGGNIKIIGLFEKTIKVDNKDITFKVKDLLSSAVENYQEGLKGIRNINMTIKIFNKIEAAQSKIELEDAEFDMLYKAIDAGQWNAGVLRFGEFFEELEKAKNS